MALPRRCVRLGSGQLSHSSAAGPTASLHSASVRPCMNGPGGSGAVVGKKSRGKKDKSAKKERKAFDRLVSGLDDLAALELVDVDDYGWPLGENGHRLAASILTMLDENAEQAGWDQPHRIISVLRPDVSAAMEADVVDAGAEYMEPSTNKASEPQQMFVLGEDKFEGEVTPVLWWFEAIEPTMAIAIQQEVYTAPPDGRGLRPSEHPDRQEVRAINLYTRGGREYSVTRWRGGEVRLLGHEAESSLACVAFAVLDAPIPEKWPRLPLPKFIEDSLLMDLVEYYNEVLAQAVADGTVELDATGLTDLMTARAGSTVLLWFFALADESDFSEADLEAIQEFAEASAQWRTGDQVKPLELSKKAAKALPALCSVISSANWETALRLEKFHEMSFVEEMAPSPDMAARDWVNEDFYEALIATIYPEVLLAPLDADDTWQNVQKVFTQSVANLPPAARPAVQDASRLFTR